ncbi:replication restart helicase PriA [Chlamydiifrater phoenicopteri]|uniref:replication restart helicase PriA n=1 Tax=Chlamydiifrater phoenicopteri TaxID=2681469 RepID=UPI001BD007D9|nr:primosomal protein N' [Chlamydiifrater phoenicopteri]
MGNIKQTTFRRYAEVIVGSTINKILDYGIPENLETEIFRGSVVSVPLRGSQKAAIVIRTKTETKSPYVFPIINNIDSGITLSEDLLELIIWMSKYYFCPLGKMLKLVIPSKAQTVVQPKEHYLVSCLKSKSKIRALIREKGSTDSPQVRVLRTLLYSTHSLTLAELIKEASVSTSPVLSLEKAGVIKIVSSSEYDLQLNNVEFFLPESKTLTTEQSLAVQKISHSLEKAQFLTHLLFGVTGSGKTEIYFQAIEKTRELGKSSIFLVPEIALTVQNMDLFRARLGKKVAILHHKLSDSEKSKTWQQASEGAIDVILGPRSALFCPLKNLGLIIVDEEHDPAYKQQESTPCYQARDVAVMRGKLANATVLLGSATPSIESYYNALSGKYQLLTLSNPAVSLIPPKVSLINMNEELEKSHSSTLFTQPVINGIEERLKKGEQTVIFYNRRGYYTSALCSSCQHVIKCKHCDVTLTFHKKSNTLACHLCNYAISPPPTKCEQCGDSMSLVFRGMGTEKIEKALYAIFPSIRIIRIDSDTTRSKNAHDELFRQFSTGKADVLIGTQMIAKGMNCPSVTLSVILNGDSGLHIPDFRASEQVFQLITQVAGRSGRGKLSGEVLIQTFLPDHSTILAAVARDYSTFYHRELPGRELCDFPPFQRLVRCIFIGKNSEETLSEIKKVHLLLAKRPSPDFQIMEITSCGYSKIKDFFRYQFLIKGKQIMRINGSLQKALFDAKLSGKVKFMIDVDPTTTFF